MFGLMYTLIREALAQKGFAREPEPMIMDGTAQVNAYADSGSQEDGIMAVSSLFHAAHATMVIRGCERVIDLGCGPGTQLVPIAMLNPETQFVGIELAPKMIVRARDLIETSKVQNIEVLRGDITSLDDVADQSADGVISTMTLHHLPSLDALRACFKQIRRVLKPGGAVYLADFGRLKLLESVRFFAHMHDASLPAEVIQDYEYSLRAAFSIEEYQQLVRLELGPGVAFYKTFLAPFMVIMKSTDRQIDPVLQAQLCNGREKLSLRFRRDLDELRRFFRLGGLPHDPFQS